jgi:CopG family nickel-responsive transcriptional regulator
MNIKKVTRKRDRSPAVRFGVSMNRDLLMEFDSLIDKLGLANRSEAIRHLVRERLAEKEWEAPDSEIIGSVTLVYNHEVRELSERLTELQHQFHKQIISTMHIHLDHHNCLEILAIKGRGREVKEIAERLLGTKGIKLGRLTTTSTGKRLP